LQLTRTTRRAERHKVFSKQVARIHVAAGTHEALHVMRSDADMQVASVPADRPAIPGRRALNH